MTTKNFYDGFGEDIDRFIENDQSGLLFKEISRLMIEDGISIAEAMKRASVGSVPSPTGQATTQTEDFHF